MSAGNIDIDCMNMSDHSAVVELWRACGIRIEPEDEFERMKHFLDRENSTGFVARISGRIVAVSLCGSDGRYGYIHHLAVLPDFRRSGITKNLVQRCVEFLRGVSRIRTVALFVKEDNTEGRIFWENAGFTRADGLEVFVINE